ncbi:hypothetical protein [Nakamurella endophytica]|uniref:hypothetical protein n=1 Tax=Nakamurella endophytica TaxID=1748367 RepID=UPI00166BBC5D|nr:hypothetical protein [Nakamurella endophytica]
MESGSARLSAGALALVVLGVGVLVVAVVAAVAGWLSDDFAAGFGQVGAIGMSTVGVVAVVAALWRDRHRPR